MRISMGPLTLWPHRTGSASGAKRSPDKVIARTRTLVGSDAAYYLPTRAFSEPTLRAAGDCGLYRVCLGLVFFGQTHQSGRPHRLGLGAREPTAPFGFVAVILRNFSHLWLILPS